MDRAILRRDQLGEVGVWFRSGVGPNVQSWVATTATLQEGLLTFAACGPFCPCVISNSTVSPSCRLL